MEAYAYILYRLVLFWGKVPPELVAAGLFAVPGLVGFLAGLPYVLDLVAGTVICWWTKGIFDAHVWPQLMHEHQRLILRARERVLLIRPGREDSTDPPHTKDRRK